MSDTSQPVPVTVVPGQQPREVVIISHSPLFYWWPVWAVGFLMAGLSYGRGYLVAFVPPDTEARREAPGLRSDSGGQFNRAHPSQE